MFRFYSGNMTRLYISKHDDGGNAAEHGHAGDGASALRYARGYTPPRLMPPVRLPITAQQFTVQQRIQCVDSYLMN